MFSNTSLLNYLKEIDTCNRSYPSHRKMVTFDEVKRLVPTADLKKTDEKKRTVLHYAAVAGDTPLVKEILRKMNVEKKGDINARDIDGSTPLSFAVQASPLVFSHYDAKQSHTPLPPRYSSNSDNVETTDPSADDQKNTEGAQDEAIAANYNEGAKLLIVDSHFDDNSGHFNANENKNISVLEQNIGVLIKNSADTVLAPTQGELIGQTPLHIALSRNNKIIAQALLGRYPKMIHRVNQQGKTALDYSRSPLIGFLLQSNADPNQVTNAAGVTPAMRFAAEENPSRLLAVSEKLDAKQQDNEGNTLLYYAAGGHNEVAMQYLMLKHKMNPGERNKRGMTPLIYVASLGPKEDQIKKWRPLYGVQAAIYANNPDSFKQVAARLLDSKALDVNAQDNEGENVVHHVVRQWGRYPHNQDNLFANLEFLAERKADFNQPNVRRETPLICYLNDTEAQRANRTTPNKDVICFLINKQTDFAMQDQKGNNIFHHLIKNPDTRHYLLDEKLIATLANKGANANQPNQMGQTPLFFAIQCTGVNGDNILCELLQKLVPAAQGIDEEQINILIHEATSKGLIKTTDWLVSQAQHIKSAAPSAPLLDAKQQPLSVERIPAPEGYNAAVDQDDKREQKLPQAYLDPLAERIKILQRENKPEAAELLYREWEERVKRDRAEIEQGFLNPNPEGQPYAANEQKEAKHVVRVPQGYMNFALLGNGGPPLPSVENARRPRSLSGPALQTRRV